MLSSAPPALVALPAPRQSGLGVVVVVAPWNYPYLTAVNAVLPALIAANAIVLKHSHQTPLCAERFCEAFVSAGVPASLRLGRVPAQAITSSLQDSVSR
jgi:acyl-CoA reductase-like NAD-dependent aldehyde dehydrogenase